MAQVYLALVVASCGEQPCWNGRRWPSGWRGMFTARRVAAIGRTQAIQGMKTPLPRTALLAGPYHPPALRKGDRAFRLFRDTDVVITSWTDARISWPRCRAIEQAGGSGLLVDEELARAVRTESVVAIKYWWRTSKNAVQNWRRALGVTRKGNPGTMRLVKAQAARKAKLFRGRRLTPEQVEQRRQSAIRLNLVQCLTPQSHRNPPAWTAEELALLGTDSDDVIAQRIGRTANAVRIMREQLGISRPKYRADTDDGPKRNWRCWARLAMRQSPGESTGQ